MEKEITSFYEVENIPHSTEKVLYATGCYGTGNLGDEAIFRGLLEEYKDYQVCQLYVNVPTHYYAINKDTALQEGFADPSAEKLIIGGGGLFFTRNIVEDFNKYADRALQRGLSVEIQGIGAEGILPNFQDAVIKLCRKCSIINVRSQSSVDILKDLGIESVGIKRDFAYNLSPDIEGAKKIFPTFEESGPIIGIVTAGSRDISDISIIIRRLTMWGFNVLHISHVRHYTDLYENDVARGEQLWSNIDIWYSKRLQRFKTLPFPQTPEILLGTYSLVDGIIGYRYHSFIFSDMLKKPLFGMPSGRKADAFFKENPRYMSSLRFSGLPVEKLVEEISTYFKEMLKEVKDV